MNQSQGHSDELLTDIVIASLHTDRQTDRLTDRQSGQTEWTITTSIVSNEQ